MTIAASSSGQWTRLTEVLDKPDWLTRPEWATQRDRARQRASVHAAIAAEIVKRPTAFWVERLEAAGLPCGPIYDIGQMFADPQVEHLGVAAEMDHPRAGKRKVLASPLNFDGAEKTIRQPAEVTGAHTAEVLAWLGYSKAEIENLSRKGVTG